MDGRTGPPESTVLERVTSPQGELVLRRAGAVLEIISNGVFLMDTRDRGSERLLVSAALARSPARAPRVLVGGLGAGFSLAEAARHTAPARIDVVEISAAVIGWHATHLRHITAAARADARVHVVNADLLAWLPRCRGRYDIVCLDIDNGPGWTVTDANGALYGDAGLRRVRSCLRPDGIVSVWSAARDEAFQARLRRHFGDVTALQVPVARGEPDVVYLAGPVPPRTAPKRPRGG